MANANILQNDSLVPASQSVSCSQGENGMNPKEGFIVPCSNWTECQETQECECAPC